MSDSEKRNVLRNSANWLDLDVVTGNTDDEVTREINLDNLATAQVYRLYVDESQQTDFWSCSCLPTLASWEPTPTVC